MALLKVYGVAMSTCTARVLACLHEKGVGDYDLLPVNLFAGEHKQPSFLAKNPFGLIPVLEDGDLTIFESRAIATYIADKYKDKGTDLVRHGDVKEAAAVRMWMEVESQHYNPAIQPIIFQFLVMPLQGQSPDQAIIDQSIDKLGAVLDVYEGRLATTKYIAGDFFSLADVFHLPYTFYLMKTPWAHLINDRPHVKAWWEDISSRPSFIELAQNLNFGDKEPKDV